MSDRPTNINSTTTPSTSSTPSTSPAPSKKERGFKPVTNADLKIYQVGQSWEAWYKRFLLLAHSCSWSDGEKIATLCHFMPEEIKEFLENLSADSFKDCDTLSKILEDLFDLYEKTEEEREKEFLNILCKPKESVASYYLRFRNLATLAKETRNEKLMKYFANTIRPLPLHQKVMEKIHKCSTLSEVYQLALLEEKELARLRKLRKEESNNNNNNNNNNNTHNRNNRNRNTNSYNVNNINNNRNNNNNNRNKNNRENNKNNNNPKSNNNNNDNNNNVPLFQQTTNWLVNHQYCAFCTKPTNDNSQPHNFEECKAKYPFYRAKEVRELKQAKKEIPTRSAWPVDSTTSKRRPSTTNNLKG
jgi:hypothetical protein